MDYRKSIRALFEAVLLEGRTTGGDYEATGQRVGAFIGKKGNNTRRNRERADRIVDRLADKEYKDKGDEGGPVGAPFNKGFRKGYVDTVRQQYESSNNARRNLRALFEAVLSEEGFEYQKPGQLSKNKRNQAEYEDRREKELSGRIVMRGGGNLLDKDLMPGAYRQAARGKRAIEADSPHSKDRYGNPRSVPDTHTFMELDHAKKDRKAKIAARERRLAAKAARLAAKAQTQNSSTDHSRDNLKNIFEAALLEGERKMRGYSDKYPGGPAEKRLMTSKPGTLSASGKKQLAAAATAYEKATSKKVESIRNIFNNILKEATYQAGKAGKTGEDGDFVGVAKLSKSKIKGLDRRDAMNKSRRRAERNAANQDDAAFRREHGKLSAAERRKANQLMNRPQGMRHKDPQDHYPQS